MHLFIYTPLNEANRASLREQIGNDHLVTFRSELAPNEQKAAFVQADALMGNPPAEWFSDVSNLKLWQLDSAGFDKYTSLNLNAAVCNMGDFFAWPCAETIVAAILALYRRIDELAVLQRQSKWIGTQLRFSMSLLHGQHVIILGAGAIGQAIKSILTGFECTVNFMARSNPEATIRTVDELKAALPDTDLLISTLPGSADQFITRDVLAAMKPGSVFANVGRGNTVDEAALIHALQTGHLGGAALDVTAQEPLPGESPLWTMTNVVLTQHTAGGQRTEDEGKIAQFVRNLKRFEQGEALENQIELSRGY